MLDEGKKKEDVIDRGTASKKKQEKKTKQTNKNTKKKHTKHQKTKNTHRLKKTARLVHNRGNGEAFLGPRGKKRRRKTGGTKTLFRNSSGGRLRVKVQNQRGDGKKIMEGLIPTASKRLDRGSAATQYTIGDTGRDS